MCPFCGLATESPHETQTACIEALQAEISHVREIVARLKAEEPAGRPALRVSGTAPVQKTRSS